MPLDPALDMLKTSLEDHGFDLVVPTNVQTYNAEVPDGFRLPDFERSSTLVLVIGNSRALWDKLGEVWDDPAYAADPVDTYTKTTIDSAVATVSIRSATRYSFDPPPHQVAIQRLAHLAGLAWLSPSHLCVHPTFGPWIALRAAVVFDTDGVSTTSIEPPCQCATGCLPAFEVALAAGEPSSKADFADRWHEWVAFRDACPVGRDHRYSDEQIRYHYTEDPTARPPRKAPA